MAADDNKSGESFLSRWSRRKVEVARTAAAAAPDATVESAIGTKNEKPNPSIGAASGAKMPEEARPERALPPVSSGTAPPLPSLESLTRDSDFAPFMRAEVAPGLRNQAMKKLFTDPHYNVMDRLDIYIDDYGKPDPIPPAMLRMMNQSKTLGLFEEEERAEQEARRAAAGETTVAPPAAAEAALAPVSENEAIATPAAAPASAGNAAEAPAADQQSFPFAPQSRT